MELIEYLYVDRRRLDSYFEQVASPVKHERVPRWTFGLGLTGPRVEGIDERKSRPYTTHEKVAGVYRHLLKTKQVVHRLPGEIPVELFWHNIVDAQRMAVPVNEGSLIVWYSHSVIGERNFGLLLFEEFSSSDDDVVRGTSEYSSLMLRLAIRAALKNRSGSGPVELQGGVSDLNGDPGKNLECLQAAPQGPHRRIEVLYRLRATCATHDEKGRWYVIAGYPIAIFDAPRLSGNAVWTMRRGRDTLRCCVRKDPFPGGSWVCQLFLNDVLGYSEDWSKQRSAVAGAEVHRRRCRDDGWSESQ